MRRAAIGPGRVIGGVMTVVAACLCVCSQKLVPRPCRVVKGPDRERGRITGVASSAIARGQIPCELPAMRVHMESLARSRRSDEDPRSDRLTLVALQAGNCDMRAKKCERARMILEPKERRSKSRGLVAVDRAGVLGKKLSLVDIRVAAFARVLRARVIRRSWARVALSKNQLWPVTPGAVDSIVRGVESEAGRRMNLSRELLPPICPGLIRRVTANAVTRNGRAVRRLVTFRADLSPYLVERKPLNRRFATSRSCIWHKVAAGTRDALMHARKREKLRVIKERGGSEGVLRMASLACRREPARMNIRMTEGTGLFKADKRVFSVQVLMPGERERLRELS